MHGWFLILAVWNQQLAFCVVDFSLICTSFAEDWRYPETVHCTEMYSLELVNKAGKIHMGQLAIHSKNYESI